MELSPSGTRQGYPTLIFSRCVKSTFREADVLTSTSITISMLRRDKMGEAYVIMNINIPDIVVEWLETP